MQRLRFVSRACLILAVLTVWGCGKPKQATFIDHQFFVGVPEFLHGSPDDATALFKKMEPSLSMAKVLTLAEKDAPPELVPMLAEWKAEPEERYIRVSHFGQQRIYVAISGAGSGSDTVDRQFEAYLKTVIEARIAELAAAK